jgi:hypothetical protein
MVRVTRFGWHDAGPVEGLGRDHDWLSDGDDEVELEPRRPKRRVRVRKTSPVDRRPAGNTPPETQSERAA